MMRRKNEPLDRKKLGDLLVEANVITSQQLMEALDLQRSSGKKLGKVLTEHNFTTEENIISALCFQLGLNRVYLHRVKPDKDLLEKVPESLLRRHEVFPIEIKGGKVLLAMSDPLNLAAVQDLEMALGMEVSIAISSSKEIQTAIQRFYGLPDSIDGIYGEAEPGHTTFYDLDATTETAVDEAPVIKVVNTIIVQAVSDEASDIHIEPREKDVRVRLRIDGVLREVMTLNKSILPPLVSRIKIMAEMDISEKRLPQDGRIQVRSCGRNVDLRVSTLPTIYGEKIVIRLLDKENQILSLDHLGLRPNLLEKFKNVLADPYGMILITGPTGSGKTTTLYASLSEINDTGRNIVTIEDPVEYLLPGINQVQTNTKTGLDFASGLRSILRQDPDVIMIGEIRDKETATIAVRSATTGHLVFSTLHTNDAAGTITRLIDMGVEPFLVASSVVGVMAQRLVRRICPACIEDYEVPANARERIYLGVAEDEPLILKRGKGCGECGFTGYRGRLAIHELLVIDSKLREQILKKASTEAIRDQAVADGMETLFQDGVEKVRLGITTIQEVLRVSFSEEAR